MAKCSLLAMFSPLLSLPDASGCSLPPVHNKAFPLAIPWGSHVDCLPTRDAITHNALA